jgi:molecular chaperone GrpE
MKFWCRLRRLNFAVWPKWFKRLLTQISRLNPLKKSSASSNMKPVSIFASNMNSEPTSNPNSPDSPDGDAAVSASSEPTALDENASAPHPAEHNPAEQLAELQAKLTEMSDAYLRAKADAENTRRRAEEDISKARKYAVESFAESLLPVKDSLEAALVNTTATPEQMLDGVTATLRQLSSALERNKILEINPEAGSAFDPHQHQAISVVPAPEQAPNTVVSVLQKGSLISDRVLRPALVTVSGAA